VKNLRVLVVEDSELDAELTLRALRQAGYELTHRVVDDRTGLRDAVATPWDVVLSDWIIPGFSALEALAMCREAKLEAPFIIVSGTIDEETAVEALRAGAEDFVLKGRLARLAPAIERGMRERSTRESAKRTEAALRASQEQLLQAQKMEAIGRVAGGVAHDFNNLLSVILSYTDLAIETLAPGDPLQADLTEVRKAGQRAAQLTQQLLALSRRQVLQPRVVDLNETVGALDNMLRRVLGEDIVLALKLGAGLDRVKVDPGQIEQVVMNLAVNARDAMPRGGNLTVETRNVHRDVRTAARLGIAPGAHVVLAISDTGTGIDPAILDRIFEPFFTTKHVGKGTGLGLSTVLGIIQQSGGAVAVDSRPGATKFEISLPSVGSAPADAYRPQTRSVAALRGSETILLVEDDAAVRALSRSILQRHGYDVHEAQGGGDALLLCEQLKKPIHLLVTDVVMPLMGGRQLAERLRPLRPQMRVLYMSGHTDDAVVHHGVLEAEVAFLQKPVTSDALLRKVRQVLDTPQR
jgi:signal transduction histidine kinase